MEERRRQFLPPESVLKDFLSSRDLVLVDIGSGVGFFTLPAARYLTKGRVYAVEIQQDMLSVLERRAKESGLRNIRPIRGSATALPLEDASVDAALMSWVLHDIDDREGALQEVHRVLKPNGIFYLLEWGVEDPDEGPPLSIRIGPHELTPALESAHFRVEEVFLAPSPLYRVLCRKPQPPLTS